VNGKNKIFIETEVKKINFISILEKIISIVVTPFASAVKYFI
jgi:hypothetical protein